MLYVLPNKVNGKSIEQTAYARVVLSVGVLRVYSLNFVEDDTQPFVEGRLVIFKRSALSTRRPSSQA